MNIKTIPFNSPFLPVLAKYMAEKHEQISPDFSSVLVIFPSERNKVYFRKYLLKETKRQGVIPPSILTIEQLYDYIFEKTICDLSQAEQFGKDAVIAEDIARNIFLKQAVEEVKFKNFGQLPFVKFIAIGRKLLSFFDELASWDLSIKNIENTKEKLHFPSQYIDEELSVFGKIRKKYEDLLGAQGLVDITSAYLTAAKNFKTEYLKEFKYIYIAGSLALTFADIMLVKKILNELPSELIIHSEKENLTDSSLDNIFYHHNKILRILQSDTQNIQPINAFTVSKNEKTAVHIQPCKNALDEVGFILNAISKLSPRYPLHRIAVVLPDESLYLPLKDALEKFNIPYNLSMGIPFKHTMLYAFLKDIYEFIDSGFSSSRFLTLLKNPVIKGITKDGKSFKESAYKLDIKIREGNLSRIHSKFQHPEMLMDYLFEIIDKLNGDCSFAEYVKNTREIIRELAESNPALRRKTSAIFDSLTEKLVKIENCKIPDNFCPKGKDKLKFITSILETISFSISGDFLSGIQVIGVLESRNIDFDCVIIPSCNEGIFPQKSEKDIFLPSNLRQEVKLPFYRERDALYSYYFHQLLGGKKEVYLSYRTDEKTQLGLRSRWIEKISENKNERFIVKEAEETSSSDFSRLFIPSRKNSSPYKKYKKIHAPRKNDGILSALRAFTFSPSILRTFKQCPYRFYLSYILKMKEPKIIIEEYDASMWGRIFHNALARLYREKYPEGYAENIKQKVIEDLLKIGEEEFKKAYPEPKASLYWDWEANQERMKRFIDMEIAHFKEGFTPIKLENELVPHAIDINGKQKLKIGGRPDRIDVKPATPATEATADKGEKYYIIDYKISKKPISKTYRISEGFTEFQLPLYGLAFAKGDAGKIGGLVYYHLDEELENFVQLDILETEGYDYIKTFQEEMLLPTLRTMFNKDLPFCQTEDLDICQRCVFIDHCRKRI